MENRRCAGLRAILAGLVVAACAIGVGGPSQADATLMTGCVNEQIGALDLEIADGGTGQTRLAQLRGAIAGKLRGRGTAPDAALCRQAGIMHAPLRAHWPSAASGRYRLVSDGQVADADLEIIEDALTDAAARLDEFLAPPLPYTAEFLAVHPAPKQSEPGFDAVREDCRGWLNSHGIAARSVFGIALICVDGRAPPPASVDKERRAESLRRAVRHEFFHAVQYQLISPEEHDTPEQMLERWGPHWLVEGSATYFQDDGMQACAAGSLDPARAAAGTAVARIREAELSWGGRNAAESPEETDLLYRISLVATCDLIERASFENILAYYVDLGTGLAWQEAFEARFGIGVEAFYRRFGA